MINPKRVTPRHILIKMAKTKDKGKILKVIREHDVINQLSWIKISLVKKSSKGSHELHTRELPLDYQLTLKQKLCKPVRIPQVAWWNRDTGFGLPVISSACMSLGLSVTGLRNFHVFSPALLTRRVQKTLSTPSGVVLQFPSLGQMEKGHPHLYCLGRAKSSSQPRLWINLPYSHRTLHV